MIKELVICDRCDAQYFDTPEKWVDAITQVVIKVPDLRIETREKTFCMDLCSACRAELVIRLNEFFQHLPEEEEDGHRSES